MPALFNREDPLYCPTPHVNRVNVFLLKAASPSSETQRCHRQSCSQHRAQAPVQVQVPGSCQIIAGCWDQGKNKCPGNWDLARKWAWSARRERGPQGEPETLLLYVIIHGGERVELWWALDLLLYPFSVAVVLGVSFNKWRYHSFPFPLMLGKQYITWHVSGVCWSLP